MYSKPYNIIWLYWLKFELLLFDFSKIDFLTKKIASLTFFFSIMPYLGKEYFAGMLKIYCSIFVLFEIFAGSKDSLDKKYQAFFILTEFAIFAECFAFAGSLRKT